MSYQGIAAYVAPQAAAPAYQAGGLEHIAYSAAAIQPYSAADIMPTFSRQYVSSEETPSQYTASNNMYALAIAQTNHNNYAFVPDNFLSPNRLSQPFIGDAEEIEEPVREAFEKTLNRPFPDNIRITILQESEFRKHAPDPGIVGFSINRTASNSISEVFLLAAEKDRILLTAGHELGHVLSQSLTNKHNEEAKAFAFTRAWAQTIKEHNIANMQHAITTENPAQNGLHDVAFTFVQKTLQTGKEALTLFNELIQGQTGVNSDAFIE
jgi:hypothetical protein